MRNRRWINIELALPARYHDLLTGQLAGIGFSGFWQEDGALACFIEASRWTAARNRLLQELLTRFRREFPRLTIGLKRRVVEERNWNATWERSAGIVEATRRIVIKPSWKKLRARDRGKIVLHIDPKMSFGTGHHETTRLCLLLLEEFLRPGMRVLDCGAGTGILAIAASKLGARTALAIDIDPSAVENARENVRRNNVARKVTIRRADITKITRKTFDLIVANLDYPTIAKTIAEMSNRINTGGFLILSGLLGTDLPRLIDLLRERGVLPVEIVGENEWVGLALTKLHADRIT